MQKLTENDVSENYSDIIHIIESEHSADVSSMLKLGARLLAVNKRPANHDFAFIYSVGWPSSLGDMPSLIHDFG